MLQPAHGLSQNFPQSPAQLRNLMLTAKPLKTLSCCLYIGRCVPYQVARYGTETMTSHTFSDCHWRRCPMYLKQKCALEASSVIRQPFFGLWKLIESTIKAEISKCPFRNPSVRQIFFWVLMAFLYFSTIPLLFTKPDGSVIQPPTKTAAHWTLSGKDVGSLTINSAASMRLLVRTMLNFRRASSLEKTKTMNYENMHIARQKQMRH